MAAYLEKQFRALRQAEHDQRQLAERDPLTGLFNRRYLDDTLPRELHRSRRANLPFCVAMLDIDHFKRFNDTHGHAIGDRVILCGQVGLAGSTTVVWSG